jgi:hypothetical protein
MDVAVNLVVLSQVYVIKMTVTLYADLPYGADESPLLLLLHKDVSSNHLVRFAGAYPGTRFLDLRNNSITEFSVTSAPALEILHLADNNLTAVPTAVFNFPKLQLLNLTGNPIRGFSPTREQLMFLSHIQAVILDQAMLATGCADSDKAALHGFMVCSSRVSNPSSAEKAVSTKPITTATIVVIVCLALFLMVGIFLACRRQKLERKHKVASTTAKLEENLLVDFDASIWSDPLLLAHRLDAAGVVCLQLLGAGMFANVHLATYGGDYVAIKSLKSADRSAIHEFVDEIKLALTLSHPRIVRAIGVTWTKESDIALVTEFLAGGDLREYLEKTVKTPGWSPRMLHIAIEIAQAVAYLHSLTPVVIHRDLKSRNVLLDSDMHAKLSDFGVSRFKLDDSTMTASVGNVRWIAPEVLAGQQYDEAVDVYSLGIIFSEIDTQKLPFADVIGEDTAEPLSDSAIAALLMSGSLKCSLRIRVH